MRIAFLAPLAESVPPRRYGGTERVVSWLVEELVARGHDVTLYASGDSRTEARLVACAPKALRPAGIADHTPHHLALLSEAMEHAADYDLIHSHIDFVAFPFAQLMPVPVLHTLHGRLDLPWQREVFGRYPGLELVSISDAQREPLPGQRFSATIHHGMPADLLRFQALPEDYLLFLGRISREKGPALAIQAAREAGWTLKLAAKVDPSDREYYEREIEPLLDPPRIEYVGEIDDDQKQALLGGARALLLPVDWPEPFGLTFIEALACGTPVIARPCGSIPEIIRSGETGILCSTLEELVAAIGEVERIDRSACRAAFEARFTVGRMVDDYEVVYRRLIEQGARPAAIPAPKSPPLPPTTGPRARPPAELLHEGEWYVSASTLSANLRKLVLKDNDAFLVADRRGDFPGRVPGEFGYYWRGTRFLSQMELRLYGDPPVVLDADSVEDDTRLKIELTNGEVFELSERKVLANTIHVTRNLVLERDVLFQTFSLHNFDVHPMEVELRLTFGADFADIFEVRGTRRLERGTLHEPRGGPRELSFDYHGLDGRLRRTEIAVEPAADEVSGTTLIFRLQLVPGNNREVRVRVCPLDEVPQRPAEQAGGAPALIVPPPARRPARSRIRHLPRIETSHATLTRMLDRAVRDLVTMLSDTPEGLYPYAGIPWYGAPFGRDGSITALQLLPWMPEVARGVLAFQARHQSRDFDDFTDREPGKVLHELRTGEMAALREIPFVPYYGSADSTPLFLILLGEYVRTTHDLELLERLWPNALAALGWIERHGDADGDGFVEYHSRSPLGLRNQAWKDSFDGISHADGRLAEPPIATCEVQGYVVRAYRAAAELAELRGDPERARSWRARAAALQDRLEQAFWLPDREIFALALDREKQPCRVLTTNPGHVLWAGAARPEIGRRQAVQLVQPALSSGFGLRTLETGAARYSPLSYHNGSVWPHDCGIVAEGLRRYENLEGFFEVFTGVVNAVERLPDQRVPELYCGFPRGSADKPIPYPVACAPQAWASGAMLHLITSLLGLRVDGATGSVAFHDPVLPPWIEWLEVHELAVPGGSMDFAVVRGRMCCSIEIMNKPQAVRVTVLK